MIDMMLTTNMSMDSLLPLLYTDDDKTPVVQNRCEEELEGAEKTKTDKMVHLDVQEDNDKQGWRMNVSITSAFKIEEFPLPVFSPIMRLNCRRS